VNALRDLARNLASITGGSEWYLFGSVDRDDASASDIDLLILCTDNTQADRLRSSIDVDSQELPLHLSLMTYEEARESDAVRVQQGHRIYPVVPTR